MSNIDANQLPENPRSTAGVLSKLLFLYTIPLFRKSQLDGFSTKNIYKPLKEHAAERLGGKLCEVWSEEVASEQLKKKTPSLLRCILKVFGKQIALLGFILFSLDFIVKLTQPIFLGMLLSRYSKGDTGQSIYLFAAPLILCSALNVLFSHWILLSQFECGMKVRIALMATVYRKTLKLSRTALETITSGKILNIMSSDVAKIDSAILALHHIWLGPLESITIVIIVYYHIGLSALAVVVVLTLFMPFQGYIGKQMMKFRKLTAENSDVRIRLMNEIIQGVQVLKMYAWEKPFGKRVADAREEEVRIIRKSNYLRSISLSCMMFVSRISIFTSLVIYAVLGQVVTAEIAFVITSYYNILRQVMTVQFPRAIEQLAEAKASLKRIQNFLLVEQKSSPATMHEEDEEELDPTPSTSLLFKEEDTMPSSCVLSLKRVSAKWNSAAENYILNNISFNVNRGEHVAITGPVGSGKSSILHVILGELGIASGTVNVRGNTIAYAPQEPWLFNGTIQQNILFGQDFDQKRYERVLKACTLDSDLDSFPCGDETLVGDRGLTLSGGQKARVNLARAIYRKADIYLLDDPLSAVDVCVARHLIEDCIHKFLHDRTVLMATHQISFLDKMHKIISLKQGHVYMGSNLKDQQMHSEFKELIDVNKHNFNNEKAAEVNNSDASLQDNRLSSNQTSNQAQNTGETLQQGKVDVHLYLKYIKLGGGVFMIATVTLFCVVSQLFATGSDYFLAYWVNFDKSKATQKVVDNLIVSAGDNASVTETSSVGTNPTDMLPIYLFTALTLGTVVVTLFRTILLFELAMNASIKLHRLMYNGVIKAYMHFFETNPVGRIINRFSKDMATVDDMLPTVMVEVIQITMALAGVIFIVAWISKWSLLLTLVIAVLLFYFRRYYLNTSRKLRRLDGAVRSPIFSHVIETLTGLSTIQAFEAEKQLIRTFDSYLDLHSSVFYSVLVTGRSFGFCLDIVCVLYLICVTYTALQSASAAELGLATTQAMGVTGMLQWGIRQSAEMENLMTCVERILEYGSVGQEQDHSDAPAHKGWPATGHIIFENVYLWYSKDRSTKAILNGISFEVRPNEKIGIVGRTGAGKSSLVKAIFQLAFVEGLITIDGKDISKIPLELLRRKISIIPQEPILFSGSVRYNLDPFNEYPDEKIWQVLEEVHLRNVVSELSHGIHEGGSNLSVGERQLICLARAILRENKILIMDEATANVDSLTDSLIQSTIREKFTACTVLVVAHRLDTVMNLDRALVMQDGSVAELDSPCSLFSNSKSLLYMMAKEAGQATFDNLKAVAQKGNERI